MKQTFALFTVLLLTFSAVYGQDKIIRTSGDTVQAKVLKVDPDEVTYKLWSYLDGPSHSMDKNDIASIIYENGTKDIFSGSSSGTGLSYYRRGIDDAKKYYTGYKPAMNWAIVSGVLFNYGFIASTVMFCTPPKYQNLNFPSADLMNKSDYRDGYTHQAGRIKRIRVAEGYGIGTGILLSVALAVAVAVSAH